MQQLCLLDYRRMQNGDMPYYVNSRFRLEFMPQPAIPKALKSIPDIKKYMLEKHVQLVPTYEVNWFEDLIIFELFQIINNDIIVKKCKNCGYYFIPSGRSDTKYCDRVRPGNTKACNEVGPSQKYKANNKTKIHTAYEKAYKRNYSRVRNNAITKPEFLEWSDKASKMRDDCRDGKISFEKFQSWLNQK